MNVSSNLTLGLLLKVTTLSFLSAVTSLATVAGNVLVLVAFSREATLRTPPNFLIASLAVTDVIIGAVSMPLFSAYLLLNRWPFGAVVCDLWLSVDYSVCLVSQYTVFVITADRFFSVTFPARYRSWRTETRVLLVIGGIWLVPLSVFFTIIMGWSTLSRSTHHRPEQECYTEFALNPLFNIVFTVCYFWVTLVAMVSLYLAIYRVALRMHRRKTSNNLRHCLRPEDVTLEMRTGCHDDHSVGNYDTFSDPTLCGDSSGWQDVPTNDLQICCHENKNKYDFTEEHIRQSRNHNTCNHGNHIESPVTNGISNHQSQINSNDNPDSASHTSSSTLSFFTAIFDRRDSVRSSNISYQTAKTSFYDRNKIQLPSHLSSASLTNILSHLRPRPSPSFPSGQPGSTAHAQTASHQNHRQTDIKNLILNTSSIPHKLKSIRLSRTLKAKKALKMITLILGAFIVSWTPYHVIVLIKSACDDVESGRSCVNKHLYDLSYWLCYLNSPINPFCYALVNQQFKISFLKLLHLPNSTTKTKK